MTKAVILAGGLGTRISEGICRFVGFIGPDASAAFAGQIAEHLERCFPLGRARGLR